MPSLLLVSQIGLWLFVLLLTCGFLVLSRQIGLIHRRFGPAGARMENAGPALGTRMGAWSGVDLNGRTVDLGAARHKQTLLVFVSPECGVCGSLMPAVRSLRKSERSRLEVVLVSLGVGEERNQKYVERYALQDIPLVISRELADEFHIFSPPYAVLIGPDRIVQSKGLVNHLDHLESLLNAAQMGYTSMEEYLDRASAS
jgi:methylamine dehydrogenase accessory protein MauD